MIYHNNEDNKRDTSQKNALKYRKYIYISGTKSIVTMVNNGKYLTTIRSDINPLGL